MAKWTFVACGAVALAAGAVRAAEADLDTLPPGSRLPSAETCATRVLGAGQPRLEDRPSNADENAARYSGPDVLIDGANHLFQGRVRGDFAPAGVTLTTREILLIGACKWGFDEQGVFGKAKVESNWFQARGADYGYGDSHTDPAVCARIDKPAPCWTSYGIMQVKGTVHEGTYPWAERSTAFNVDYALGWQRACFEGGFDSWIGNAKGDLEGCVGAWFSGKLRDSVAQGYIAKWNQVMAAKPWYNNRAFLRMDGSPQSLPETGIRSASGERDEPAEAEAARLRAAGAGPAGGEAGLGAAGWREVQLALAALGHDPGAPDGTPGRRTRQALAAWQRSRGLEPTGRLGPDDREALVGR